MRRLLLLVCAGLSLPACSSDESKPAPSVDEELCDQQLVADCLVNQQGCSLTEGEPQCVTCGVGEFANRQTGACDAIGGEPLSHTFPDNTTPSGGEIVGMCRSWTLNNETELWINAVELSQDEVSHHSNWMFVPEDEFDGPDGIWPCQERDYSQLAAALAGGVVYAQSTQASHEVQKFPDGAGYRIPPHARIISDIHTLNTTSAEVMGAATLTVYAIPAEDVTVKLAPFHVDYHELAIQPLSTSRFTGECDLRSAYGGGPLDFDIYYVLPHTHALGVRMFVEGFGGEMDGKEIIDVTGFNGEARGRAYDPPLDMSGAHGLRFGCEFDNPRNEEVNWGFDDQEMCEALGFAASPVAFESTVSEAVAGEMDGTTHTFSGACNTVSFSWASKN